MATHDYVIANGTGAAVRSDLNNALAAIVSNNSSATEPTTTYSYMWWADSTAGQLKLRNAADDGWIVIQELDGTMLMEDGTVGAPGLAFASDLDTGFYRPAANELGIATGGTNAVYIDDAQQVGLGTSSPQKNFVVSDGGAQGIELAAAESGNSRLLVYNRSTSAYAPLLIESSTLQLITGTGFNALHIDSSQRLLVGTTSARSNFYGNTPDVQIERAADRTRQLLINNNNGSNASEFIIAKTRGTTVGSNTVVQDNDQLGIVHFAGADGTNLVIGASITGLVDGTPGTDDMPGRLVFSTTADGASSPTERMRINSNGIIQARNGAGDTLNLYNAVSAGTSSAFIYGVHSSTSAYTGTTSFIVYTNGNVVNTNGSYTTLSDVRLKENIVDAGPQWDDLKAIRIRNWNFKEETGYETHRQIGPIAQELEQVCPGLVFDTPDRDADGNKTGEVTKGINQSVLYMKAVKALQEAMERIEQLETSNADLLARVTALEAQ